MILDLRGSTGSVSPAPCTLENGIHGFLYQLRFAIYQITDILIF